MPPWEIKKTYQRETVDPFTLPEHQEFISLLDEIEEIYIHLRKITPDNRNACYEYLYAMKVTVEDAMVMAKL